MHKNCIVTTEKNKKIEKQEKKKKKIEKNA